MFHPFRFSLHVNIPEKTSLHIYYIPPVQRFYKKKDEQSGNLSKKYTASLLTNTRATVYCVKGTANVVSPSLYPPPEK